MALGEKYGILVYEPEDADEDADGEDQDKEGENEEDEESPGQKTVERDASIRLTAHALGEHIFNELGIARPLTRPLGVVLTPQGTSLALVLCDNFHHVARPVNVDVEKVQKAWGFADTPSWMLDACSNDWSTRKVHSR